METVLKTAWASELAGAVCGAMVYGIWSWNTAEPKNYGKKRAGLEGACVGGGFGVLAGLAVSSYKYMEQYTLGSAALVALIGGYVCRNDNGKLDYHGICFGAGAGAFVGTVLYGIGETVYSYTR